MMDDALLFVAALAAGVLNAVAGGGSFIALPALLFYGLAPTVANATSAMSVLPGYFSSAFGFRRDIRSPAPLGVLGMTAIAAAGGASGAVLLLATGDRAFSAVVPWLMLFATAVFALQTPIRRAAARANLPAPAVIAGLYLACLYGGYFNGGAGIVIIALLGLLSDAALITLVATKALFSAVMGSISVATYGVVGLIDWPLALLMAVGATLGGLAGARLGYWLPPLVHRYGIVIIGLIMAGLMFARGG